MLVNLHTCAPRGSSVVDYALVSMSLKPHVKEFDIGDLTISDHFPLTLVLDLHSGRTPAHPGVEVNTESSGKIIVNNTLSLNFHQLIRESTSIASLSSILKEPDPFAQIQSFECLIDHILRTLGSNPKRSTVHGVSNKKDWFDKECRDLKALIRATYLAFRKSNAPCEAIKYFFYKKQFNALLVDKKQKYTHAQWIKLLQAIQQKNNNFGPWYQALLAPKWMTQL